MTMTVTATTAGPAPSAAGAHSEDGLRRGRHRAGTTRVLDRHPHQTLLLQLMLAHDPDCNWRPFPPVQGEGGWEKLLLLGHQCLSVFCTLRGATYCFKYPRVQLAVCAGAPPAVELQLAVGPPDAPAARGAAVVVSALPEHGGPSRCAPCTGKSAWSSSPTASLTLAASAPATGAV